MSIKPRQQISSELLVVPDPQVPSEVFLIARDSAKGESAFYFSSNGGKSFKALIPAPTKKSRAGSVLTLADDLSAEWRFQGAARQSSVSSSAGGSFFVPFQLVGDLSEGVVVGYFKVPVGKTALMRELQVSVQDTADLPIIIDVVNGSGVAQGRAITLASGSKHFTFTFPTPLSLSSKSIWMMKVLSCGSISAPGANLTILAGIEYTS
jgi:hypothetical protein